MKKELQALNREIQEMKKALPKKKEEKIGPPEFDWSDDHPEHEHGLFVTIIIGFFKAVACIIVGIGLLIIMRR